MTEREAMAEALLLAMDGDFLPGAGMGCHNAGRDVALGDATPKEIAWWAADVLEPWRSAHDEDVRAAERRHLAGHWSGSVKQLVAQLVNEAVR